MVRLFGSEAEYSLSALDQGRRVEQGLALRRLFDLARSSLAYLPDLESSGMFLSNSLRLYVDCEKVEAAGPEVIQPWDAVRYTRAGERILARLAEQMSSTDGLEVILSRCNIGYGSQPTTWAFHLSVSHRVEPRRLITPLTAHLISRIPYAGAGGFNNRAAGIRFMVSPRAVHITSDISNESTHSRGIFHLRNEPLCHDHNRLHILTGENLCSDLGLWLTIAMTVLVVALVEADAWTDADPRFTNPVQLLHGVAFDTTGHYQFASVDGRRWTANSLQQYILQRIEQRLDHPSMPSWAPVAVEQCATVLRQLRESPAELQGSLDWCIKQAIFQQWSAKRGVDWRQLADWNHILEVLRTAMRAATGDEVWHVTADVLSRNSPVASAVNRLTPFLQSRALDWGQLETVLDLRQQLFELDSRFGELRPQSIFHQLDSSGQLQHRVEGVCRIDDAMTAPPEGSRASLRGRLIQQLFPQRDEYACDWQSIQHLSSGRYLDLSSPLASEERWQEHHARSRVALRAGEIVQRQRLRGATRFSRAHAAEIHRRAITFYRQGSYRQAEELLESMPLSNLADESRRLLAWVRARRGGQPDPEILRRLHPESAAAPLWWIVDQLFVARFGHGLLPHPQMATWLQRGADSLTERPNPCELQVEVFREHQAAWLLCQQRLQASRDVLLPFCHRWLGRQDGPPYVGRALCTLSEIHRRQADLTTATQLQSQAEQMLRSREAYGDVAEFALTARARLQSDSNEGLRVLEEALHLQARQGHRVGQARSLLLLARLTHDRRRRRSVKRQLQLLQQQCPALQHCPLLTQILQAWRRWTHRHRTPDEHGNIFWGV